MFYKKVASFIIVLISLFFVCIHSVSAEEIQRFTSDISINANGTMQVVETILYDFGSLSRHGIFRTIPFIKTNAAGKKFRLDISNIIVTNEKGSRYQFTISDSN